MEVNTLVQTTFNKIAAWHNDDSTVVGLKHLTTELIDDIAGTVFNHLGLTFTSELKMDAQTREKIEAYKKDKELIAPSKPVNEMSDVELMEEVRKRQSRVTNG